MPSCYKLFELVLVCSGCVEFLKLLEIVFVNFELSGLVQFVSSCCRLLKRIVGCCGLFRLFRLFQVVSSCFRLFQKVLVAQVVSVVQLLPICVGQCEVANVLNVVFGSSCCSA